MLVVLEERMRRGFTDTRLENKDSRWNGHFEVLMCERGLYILNMLRFVVIIVDFFL